MADKALVLAVFLAKSRSEEHTSELQSRQYLHSFPTRRSSDLTISNDPTLSKPARTWITPVYMAAAVPPAMVKPTSTLKMACIIDSLTCPDIRLLEWRTKRSCSRSSWPKADRKSTRLNSSHANIYTLSLHDALPI